MDKIESITRLFMERKNLKFTRENMAAMVDTTLDYELQMLFKKARLIKVIKRSKTVKNLF